MSQSTSVFCHECKHSITEQGYKCVDCSNFHRKEIFYCQRCFGNPDHKELDHKLITVDYTKTTINQLINSIIQFEKPHLPSTVHAPEVFPYSDGNQTVWKRDQFSKISYLLPNEMPFKDSIPFVCDYLRMNNSLKYLADKLNLNLCSTDMIILILKYCSFDIRLFIIEQLYIFQRPIPIYFGVPCSEKFSMKYYFLMHEMLHMLLPYKDQKLPFILSFGTPSCKEKTLLLNSILKTNFDCHDKTEFNFEIASNYYHHKLIQLLLSHQYDTDRGNNNETIRNYQCHVLDLHGAHDWNEMPNFFVEFMSVIVIHLDDSDVKQIDSLAWPTVTFNQTATYFIFIHGNITDADLNEDVRPRILNRFGVNKTNVHVIRAKAINEKTVKLGVITLFKKACISTNSLFNTTKQSKQHYNMNLSTNVDTLFKSKTLLAEFYTILNTLSKDDPGLDLFPLSRIKELSEKSTLSADEEQQKKQLIQKLNDHSYDRAHSLLTKLAELAINNDNDITLFEKAILFWNTILRQQKREVQQSPISILQHLEMSKDRFLREFQERSKGYTNLNGINRLFDDSDQIETALIQIYQHSFHNQEYIEIINATSSITYPQIFQKTFSKDLENIKKFFVIGIIGEQSGGKSFLINKVFGTKIAESKFKCTTGILVTQVNVIGHETVKNIIVLDTEGLLDQTKQNDQAQIFDRKIVLAVMARSHVVMINITKNVNKTMQQIFEIVFYGLNKLHVTNKPKMIFLFRDQDPRTMGEDGQRTHVTQVMTTIEKSCTQVNFNIQQIINGFDIHEFPSPFVDLLVGEREISFFNNSFCQKALSLRLKIIDHLSVLTPFESFNEWLSLMLDLWQQISHNSNLFDYESLIHLTLEKDLETFSNRVLTEANRQMREIIDNFLNNPRNNSDGSGTLHKIEQTLTDEKQNLLNNLLEQLIDEKNRLIQKHNLGLFPESLYEITKLRIQSSLNLYKTDHYMAVTRQFQQDELQKKLLQIPESLSRKIRDTQTVCENITQFDDLFRSSSARLLNEFKNILETDYRNQSVASSFQLISDFVQQNKIDHVGVKYFYQHFKDSKLIEIIEKAVLTEQQSECTTTSLALLISQTSSTNHFGVGIFRRLASYFSSSFPIKNGVHNEQLLEQMLTFLKTEYISLRNSPYYDNNVLPISELANGCVQHIRDAIKNNHTKNQDIDNLWYTCYGIMLNIFTDEHYKYIHKKLISEFEQGISRAKEEVQQNIVNATTAEEYGQAIIKQIWTIIQNDIQKRFEDQFERFFATWEEYHPSIISENCVNQLFRSVNYPVMLKYIKDPTIYIKDWLRSEFNKKYTSTLAQTLHNLSKHLETDKKKFSRMVLAWYNAIEPLILSQSISDLTDSLTEYLSKGTYTKNNISLTEQTGGFAILSSATIRMVPASADRYRFLKSMYTTSNQPLFNDSDVSVSTKKLISSHAFNTRLFDRFYNRSKGCGIPCPYCTQICDNDNPLHSEHRTDHHLLWVFRGHRNRDTEKPDLVCCTSNEAFALEINTPADRGTYLPFTTHIERINPTWKIINKMSLLQDFLLAAYIALEEDLAEYYRFKGRADTAIRKKFLRSTVTPYCYSLLIGIDYENTSSSLNGIPSKDVSSIEKQLKLSAIACPENLHMLKNNQATKENILTRLNTIVNNMDQRATFIFYFSGHGGRTSSLESYLLTSDRQKLTARELADVISKAKTNKIIIMLDSCYSGGMGNAFRFDLNNSKHGIHLLCASHENQVAYQFSDDQNGFFTKYLIKGLKGEFSCQVNNCNECIARTQILQKADIRKITSTELILYLKHAVTKYQQFDYSAISGSEFDISFLD
jgi:hypothetical protein